MAEIEHSHLIQSVAVVRLIPHDDERGRFVETFRQEWLPGAPAMVQQNLSASRRGVLRGLHYHLNQADYTFCPQGRFFVALYDLRRSSPTRGTLQTIEIDGQTGVYVPPGVAHGFQALEDSVLVYLVDQYYDGDDERGVAWDDPTIGVPWPLPEPILSDRDQRNPKAREIPEAELPR